MPLSYSLLTRVCIGGHGGEYTGTHTGVLPYFTLVRHGVKYRHIVVDIQDVHVQGDIGVEGWLPTIKSLHGQDIVLDLDGQIQTQLMVNNVCLSNNH